MGNSMREAGNSMHVKTINDNTFIVNGSQYLSVEQAKDKLFYGFRHTRFATVQLDPQRELLYAAYCYRQGLTCPTKEDAERTYDRLVNAVDAAMIDHEKNVTKLCDQWLECGDGEILLRYVKEQHRVDLKVHQGGDHKLHVMVTQEIP